MKHETVAIVCCFILAITVSIIDFSAANERWCKTYPEWCEPVEIAEVANYEDNENGCGN